MRWLLNRPPAFYAYAYITLIIGFAIGYCFLYNQIYQSNRNYEKYESKNKLQKDFLYDPIITDAEIGVITRFKNKFKDSFVVRDNYYSLYSGNISIRDVKFENDSFIFKLYALPYMLAQPKLVVIELSIGLEEPLSTKKIYNYFFKNVQCKILQGDNELADFVINLVLYSGPNIPGVGPGTPGAGTGAPGAGTPDTNKRYHKHYKYYDDSIILSQITTNMDDEMSIVVQKNIFFNKIFPYQNKTINGLLYILNGKNNTQDKYTFPISESLDENLKSISLGLTNYPNSFPEIRELFLKMLYFSITIIATLGFGDIVPISSLARFLVSLEVILGILVVGLFLNSLANKIMRE